MSSRPASPPAETTTSSDGEWSKEEEKAFEMALADAMPWKSELESVSSEEEKRRWEEVAGKVGTKTSEEVRKHYKTLVEDIRAIEAGRVPVPCYVGEEKEKDKDRDREKDTDGCGGRSGLSKAEQERMKGIPWTEQERMKGIPWTEQEHKLFLLGLGKFGKGDWRSISRNFVISRTPTQVASHAQKYFIRLNSMNRDRRRSSIHDITSVNGGEAPSTQGTMTGHVNATAIGPSVKHPPQANMPGLGMYVAPVGQPLTGHMVSAVGTPVMLPPGHSPYVVPMAYPVPPSPAMHL